MNVLKRNIGYLLLTIGSVVIIAGLCYFFRFGENKYIFSAVAGLAIYIYGNNLKAKGLEGILMDAIDEEQKRFARRKKWEKQNRGR